MSKRGPKPKTLADFPGLTDRYRRGETLEQLEAAYRATRRTLVRLLRDAGEMIRHGATSTRLSAGQRAARTHHRRRRFTPDTETSAALHRLADTTGKTPEEIIALAVTHYEGACPCPDPSP